MGGTVNASGQSADDGEPGTDQRTCQSFCLTSAVSCAPSRSDDGDCQIVLWLRGATAIQQFRRIDDVGESLRIGCRPLLQQANTQFLATSQRFVCCGNVRGASNSICQLWSHTPNMLQRRFRLFKDMSGSAEVLQQGGLVTVDQMPVISDSVKDARKSAFSLSSEVAASSTVIDAGRWVLALFYTARK